MTTCCFSGGPSPPLYVILPYFNFCGFKRRRQLFLEFVKRYSCSAAKLVVVEALGPAPLGHVCGVHKHIKVRPDSHVWLKENLINLGAKALPEDWKYIAWIDADIKFLNRRWIQATIEELQDADMVQMWRSAINLGPEGEVIKTDKSFAYMSVGSGTAWSPTDKYGFWHPGYAWACTRQAYQKMDGLIDWAILGSGDRHMAMALAGMAVQSAPQNIHANYKTLLKLHEKKVRTFKVSWVDGTIVHFWHGSLVNRKYKERWEILTRNNFNPMEDVEFTENGLMRLTADGRRLEKQLDDYFIGRKEDGDSTE